MHPYFDSYKKPLFLIAALLIISASFSQVEHKQIQSVVYNTTRDITVFLPTEYRQEPNRKFEVLYVFDAQSDRIFNLAVGIADYLAGNAINPMIIVGIKTTDRWDEFLPAIVHPETTQEIQGYYGKDFKMGHADELIKHLRDEVFPLMKKEYRILPARIGIGHSLGGTFLTYINLQYPDMFDATISASPNLNFDKEAMLEKIKAFKNKEDALNAYSFIGYGKIDSYETKFYPSTKKAIALFEKYRKSGILFNSKEFADANHFTILPKAIEAGLLDYHNTIFMNGANTVKYYKNLEAAKEITITADNINNLAYKCFWNEKTDDAITIMKWGLEKFPNDYNLYDSMGEFMEAKKNHPEAQKNYQKAITLLMTQKASMNQQDYDGKMSFYLGNLKRVSN